MMDDPTQHHAAHFGFESVSPDEKTARIHHVFEDVAAHYDLMNDVMSAGLHRLWKRRLIERLNLGPSMTILDMAGGTGDVALGCHRWLSHHRMLGEQTQLIVCDVNLDMLRVGQKRAWDQGIVHHLAWVQDDACILSTFEDQSVDVYVVAFGLRNMTYLDQVLAQARRVLKPDGRFFCLEFSPIQPSLWQKIYNAYLTHMIPRIGHWLAGHEEAYRYLAESIMSFPEPAVIENLLSRAGFRYSVSESWTHGVVHLHRAWGMRS